MREIIFYAPLGKNTPANKIGGAEAGCLKTKKIYEDAGFKVIPIEKPALSRGRFSYLSGVCFVPIKLFFILLFHHCSVLHVVGFYTKIAWYELILVRIGKFMGHRVIYELRNGSMITTYEEGNDKYRKTLQKLLLIPDVVLCQGQEYVDFIREKWNVERSYYPNYIMDDFIVDNNLNRPHPIRLIYFGRVTESKNIDIIINVLSIIRLSGLEATLDIIGGYDDAYKKLLDKIVNDKRVSEFVTFYGRQPFDFIAKKLLESHYFVFPSSEKQEGHSNSLTEAMGCGVVPIVSTAGFNVSICGDKDLVVPSMKSEDYAAKIIEIENSNNWAKYSTEVYTRVLNHFTQSIVGHNLVSEVNALFER